MTTNSLLPEDTATALLVRLEAIVRVPSGCRRILSIGLLVGAYLIAGPVLAGAQDQPSGAELDAPPRIVGGEAALYDALQYPAVARREKIEGTVVVRFFVTPDGAAEPVGVQQPVHPLLDREAQRVLQRVSFTPGRKDGKAVLTAMTIPIHFDLDAALADTARTTPSDAVLQPGLPAERVPVLIGGLASLRKEVRYPRKARRKGIEGRVVVRFVVSKEGVPTEVRVVEPVHPRLDAEAVRAVGELAFLPGIKDGEPVAVQMSIPVTFGKR